jgi:hypothetical protein
MALAVDLLERPAAVRRHRKLSRWQADDPSSYPPGVSLFRSRRSGLRLGNELSVAFYGAAMAPDLKHPATGDLIVLADGEQLWRIGWPGAPVLVVTKNGPDGNAIFRLADPKCKTWNKVGDMTLVPWPEAGS